MQSILALPVNSALIVGRHTSAYHTLFCILAHTHCIPYFGTVISVYFCVYTSSIPKRMILSASDEMVTLTIVGLFKLRVKLLIMDLYAPRQRVTPITHMK